jgi:hypothetical protein
MNCAVRKSKIAGNGLFAICDIQQGTVIACIEHPITKTEDEVEKAGFPSDSVIFLDYKPTEGKKIKTNIFDETWKYPIQQPLWYFMNHASTEANCVMQPIKTEFGPSVCWRTKKDVETNDELTFNYQIGTRLVWNAE